MRVLTCLVLGAGCFYAGPVTAELPVQVCIRGWQPQNTWRVKEARVQ